MKVATIKHNGSPDVVSIEERAKPVPFVSKKGGKQALGGTADNSVESLEYLATLAKLGIFKPLVDKTYTLEQIREAHARVESGHKRGSVVVKMGM